MKNGIMKNGRATLLIVGVLLGGGLLVVDAASPDRFERSAVAAVLMGEARGEGKKGMTAVAEVIHRRAEIWDTSALSVITRPRHFSCLNRTSLPRLIGRFQRRPQFSTALEIAETMLARPDRLPGLTRGATHFATIESRPYWTSGEDAVAVIGNHAFYKLDL